MSGNHHHRHSHDHKPSGHGNGHVLRPLPRLRSRRAFLGDIGGGALALAVLTPVAIAACSNDESTDGSATSTTVSDGESTSTSVAADDTDQTQASGSESDGDADSASGEADTELRWARANLGFVSAFVVARGNSAAIIDTGTAGSAETIGQSLADLGLTYTDVDSVILTHNHGDHIGSIGDVLTMAANATAYAGEADLGGIDAEVTGLVGGEDVFGMEMLATPGHTPGSISVIDRGSGLLIAGDALVTEAGQAAEPPAEFTADADVARDSIRSLAAMTFNTLLVGHGDPIDGMASESVAALAASF